MSNKSIIEQIEDTKKELEQVEKEERQQRNKLNRIKNRESEKERKARTRRLVAKGAILESINPDMAQLEGEFLKQFLRQVFLHERPEEYAKIMLNKQNCTDNG